jgi:multiple sugar transport system substrate-binding protein
MTRAVGATALVASAALLAGCAGAGAEASGAGGTLPKLDPDTKVEIVFESYNLLQAGMWTDTVGQLIDEFEEKHPNITVKGQGTQGAASAGQNTVGSVQTQLLAGNPPDVAQITFDGLDYIVNEVGAQPIEKLAGSDAIDEHFGGKYPFDERARTLADWDGVTYGLPYVFSTPVLFYNATALEAAGFGPDVDLSSWDKVKDVARAVTAKTGKPAISTECVGGKQSSWCFQAIVRSAGGRVLSEDREQFEVAEGGALEAVEMLRGLADEGLLLNADLNGGVEAFGRGDAVFSLMSSAATPYHAPAAKAGGWTLASTELPGFDGRESVPTQSGSALFMFSTDPQKQAAAWEFMKWMTSDRAYEVITTNFGYLPLRTSLTEEGGPLHEWLEKNPLMAPNLEQLGRLEPWVSYPGKSYVQINDILTSAVDDAVFYGKDPAETLGAAQERAQAMIAE